MNKRTGYKLWKAYWLYFILGIPGSLFIGFLFAMPYFAYAEIYNEGRMNDDIAVRLIIIGPLIWFLVGWIPLWRNTITKNQKLLTLARASSIPIYISFLLVLVFIFGIGGPPAMG